MDTVPDNIVNKKLYLEVKKESDKIYKRPGLYRSAWIQKEYQKRGGKYKGEKPPETKGINRWLSGEQWVEVKPYLTNNKVVECGSSDRKGKACRPLKRVNDKTPITLPELIKLHGKKKLLEITNKKIKDMDGRVNWKKATFKPSK